MTSKVLVAYSVASSHVSTTMDYLLTLKRYSDLDISYLHVTHGAVVAFDLNRFDAVFVNYCARLCFPGYVSESFRRAMANFRGPKVLAVQDEYNQTNNLKDAIKALQFDVVLTCVPQDQLEFVYPRREFPNVEFVTVLTGYVPDELVERGRRAPPLEQRPITVGYRGRQLFGYYGRLGFEKYEIGRRMQDVCRERGIPCDIAMDETSRIYGDAWYQFIGRCRAMLGSESGSNVFDFDGSLERTYNKMAEEAGGSISYEQFAPVIADREDKVAMGQISPRVFECAVMHTPMILYRGRYSGIIEPEMHYIPLEKDFSNIDDVLRRLDDFSGLEALARRTFDHLVGSGKYGYRAYAKFLQELLTRKMSEKARDPAARPATAARPICLNDVRREEPTPLPLGRNRYDFLVRYDDVCRLEQEVNGLVAEFDRIVLTHRSGLGRIAGTLDDFLQYAAGETHRVALAYRVALREQIEQFENVVAEFKAAQGAMSAAWVKLCAEHFSGKTLEIAAAWSDDFSGRPSRFLKAQLARIARQIRHLNSLAFAAANTGNGVFINRRVVFAALPYFTAKQKREALRHWIAFVTHLARLTAASLFSAWIVRPIRRLVLGFSALVPTEVKLLILRVPLVGRIARYIRLRLT